jgi:glutathione S-transferase
MDRMFPRAAGARASAVGYGTFDDTFNTLEKLLKNAPFILGENFSAVDLYLSSQLGFGFMTKMVEPRPICAV